MGIIVVGLSHKTAPIEVREKLNFPESTLPDSTQKADELTRVSGRV